MSQGEQQPAQPFQQSETMSTVPTTPLPVIGDYQWNKDITGILTSNANNTIAELGFNPNVLRALKAADSDVTQLKAEKKILENKCRDLSAHLALANNRIDFSNHDTHTMWKEVVYFREKHHVLQKQYQDVLRAHAACATGPPEQPYFHLLQELEKLQDMYRHILGQNSTLKFEVQRLMQQCVNSGLIPPPQNYTVTPIPALQPPVTARRVSEPAVVGRQHQVQVPVQYAQGAQLGQVMRQSISNPHAPNLPTVNNPMIVAGPAQAHNSHRTQFPQPQQAPSQQMPPPQQPLQQTTPQYGQPSVPQQHPSTIRPRPVIDLTNSDDERIPKRPRMASDPNVFTHHSPGSASRFQHQVYAQVPAPVSYQVLRQINPQPQSQVATMDHQRLVTGTTNQSQRALSFASPFYVGTNTLSNIPAPPTSAPPIMDAYRAVTGEEGAMRTQGQPPDVHGQRQGIGQPRRAHTDPAHPANAVSQIPSTADAGVTKAAANANSAERSAETPLGSTPIAPPQDSVPVTPQVTNGQMQGGGSSLPSLTEEQTEQMRLELADSMFTEPEEDDETQTRICVFCDHRRELGLLPAPPQQFSKPTTEEMYSHLQAEHSESLEVEELDWKMELFGMGPTKNQEQ